MTFADRLNKLLEDNRVTGLELAKITGVSSASVTGWRKGAIPTADIACKIAAHFNTTVEYLITGSPALCSDSPNYFFVPVLNDDSSSELTGYIPVPKELAKYEKNLISILIQDDSMNPTLEPGDTVICDNLAKCNSDGLYAIKFNNIYSVRRLQFTPDKVLIICDNKLYNTIEQSINDISVIGKVHNIIKQL